MLANRSGFSRRFTPDDLALFDTLAANASAALQYDRLEQAVSELRDLQEQLHHQAYHDPLTGLANRALFRQEVRAALRELGRAAGSRSCSSTSTTSRRSTTRSAMPSATSCCGPRRGA